MFPIWHQWSNDLDRNALVVQMSQNAKSLRESIRGRGCIAPDALEDIAKSTAGDWILGLGRLAKLPRKITAAMSFERPDNHMAWLMTRLLATL